VIYLSDQPIKRNHHYIPKFHLAGFTKKGTVDSPLWVFDSETGKQWESKPVRVAFEKDLYTIELPDTRPDAIEDAFALVESAVAPIIKNIYSTLSMPKDDNDFNLLINYIALLSVRIPERRETFNDFMVDVSKIMLEMTFAYPERFETIKQEMAGKGIDVSRMSYEEMHRFFFEGKYNISFDNVTHIKNIITTMDAVLPTLARRNWCVVNCPETVGDFICSDNPVNLHWMEQRERGFFSSPGHGLDGTEVSIPLSSRVLLLGRYSILPKNFTVLSQRSLAILNSFTGINSMRYLYSRKNDFVWFTKDEKVGTITDFKKIVKKKNDHKVNNE
jgi:hypothetical protein